MTAVPVEPRPWPRRRWGMLLLLVFTVQIALIYWLSDHSPVHPRPTVAAPLLRLAGGASTELLTLSDPTLFVLPHPQGFSGPAWLTVPRPEFQPFDWSEPPRWLPLTIQDLGAAFNQFMQTNRFAVLQNPTMSEPQFTRPALAAVAARQQSTLRIEGDLARRWLLTPLQLSSWTNADVLANSVVQVVVDAEGRPISATLYPDDSGPGPRTFGSGLKEADEQALALAKAARFNPMTGGGPDRVTSPTAQLTWGRMIFQWHTLPVATNAPPATPQP